MDGHDDRTDSSWAQELFVALVASADGDDSRLNEWWSSGRRLMVAYFQCLGADPELADASATDVVTALMGAIFGSESIGEPVDSTVAYVKTACRNHLSTFHRKVKHRPTIDPLSDHFLSFEANPEGTPEESLEHKALRALVPSILDPDNHSIPQPAKEIIRLRLFKTTRKQIFAVLVTWLDPPIGPDECKRRWDQSSQLLREAMRGVDLHEVHSRLYSTRNRFELIPPPPSTK